MLHLLVPTTDLLNEYHDIAALRHRGARAVREGPAAARPGIHRRRPSFTLGIERYRYPQDLPKVRPSGGADTARHMGLPDRAARSFGRRSWSPTSAPTRAQYGNQGILLNSDALKQWLFGPLDGPPRNTAQIGQPG